MAKAKKNVEEQVTKKNNDDNEDFSKDLISEINRALGENELYNFDDETKDKISVNRWISTGCTQLDYLLANRSNGGYPEGRIIEIFGPNSIGKSLLGYQAIKSVQKMGGIGFLIDTEYATSPDYLETLGIDVKNRFIFSQQKCIEKIFSLIDQTITLATNKKTDAPILIVWDSVAASASKAELEGDYEKTTIGETARALSKGLKRITEVIGRNNVTLLMLNQTRTKIGVLYGDPEESCGGNALKYYSSVRIKLSGGASIYEDENKKDLVIGNKVIASTIKNKVAPPRKRCEFEIIFGKGTFENDQLFDSIRQRGITTFNGKIITLEGTGAWKTFTVKDEVTDQVLAEEKFYKQEFTDRILKNEKYNDFINALMNEALVTKMGENDRESKESE